MGHADQFSVAPTGPTKVHRLVRKGAQGAAHESEDKNDIRYWLPRIDAVTDRIPETWLCAPASRLISLADGAWPEYFGEFLDDLAYAGRAAGYPCFLRTGHASFKHSWKGTCFVESPMQFVTRVRELVEESELASLMGLPYDVFAVRKMLKTVPLFHAFRGMPVTREFRFFTRDGKYACHHPYWPMSALEEGGPDTENWRELLDGSHVYGDAENGALLPLVEKCGAALPGYWSIDALEAEDGWYVIDCAVADDSWHWPGCPNDRRGL
jgi:hypothetical protein